MRDRKYYIAFDDFERRIIINCLNEIRNKIIASGKFTDAVDEVLLKIIGARQKKFIVIFKATRLWKSTNMMKATGCGMNCKVTIIGRV